MYSCSNVSVFLYIFTMKYTNCEARVMLLTQASSNLIHLISKGIEFITFFRHGHNTTWNEQKYNCASFDAFGFIFSNLFRRYWQKAPHTKLRCLEATLFLCPLPLPTFLPVVTTTTIIFSTDQTWTLLHSKNYGVKITPPVLIEDYTMHFTPVLNLRCYFNTQCCYCTPLVVILTLFGVMFKL